MLKLIKRCSEFVDGYREYCRELYDNNVAFFRPMHPDLIDDNWFYRTLDVYKKKESGLIHPQSIHYWAIDGEKFIGEFQLRTEFTEKVMNDIGSMVLPSGSPNGEKDMGPNY